MKLASALPWLALAAAGGLSIGAGGCAKAMGQNAKSVASPDGPSRQGVELTVYADDFAMVRETRRVELSGGRAHIGIQGVSKTLDQNSVLFTWPKGQEAHVVASTYDLGIGTSGRLLERLLGHEVELVYRGEDGHAGDRVRGILEVAEPGNVVIRAGNRYIVNPNAQIEAPAEGGITTLPQLSVEVDAKGSGPTDLGVSYMTNGLSWNADYTATLEPGADRMKLECWATVTNKTGTDFPDATLRFVAGAPNRAVRSRDYVAGFVSDRAAAKAIREPRSEAQMNQLFNAPQAMGELVAYPYKASATVRQDQMNRVRMMGADEVAVKRVYSVALPPLYREYDAAGDPNRRITATMAIHFANAVGSGLGLPLPAGALRVYEPDKEGAARYVGAATIGDTPKDANVSLELTNVFDLYARARQVSARRIDKRHTARTMEVTVSNEKAKRVEVRLVQSYGGGFKVESETAKSTRLNSATNEWRVTVPAGGETKLRYTAVIGG